MSFWVWVFKNENKAIATILLVTFVVLFASWIVGSTMEARTFRRLSGRSDVTWFDALWVELRMIECETVEE
jgi:uncharacterized membrane protein